MVCLLVLCYACLCRMSLGLLVHPVSPTWLAHLQSSLPLNLLKGLPENPCLLKITAKLVKLHKWIC